MRGSGSDGTCCVRLRRKLDALGQHHRESVEDRGDAEESRGRIAAGAAFEPAAPKHRTVEPRVSARGEPLHQLPREYTCDGADISPPLRWHGIPPDAAELVLFAINLYPANGKLFFDWSVAGINPKLGGLQAGRLPSGAVVGRNGLGHNAYSICPPGSAREQYVFVLFAPPKKLSAQPGFEPLALRSQILDIAPSAGLLSASYTH